MRNTSDLFRLTTLLLGAAAMAQNLVPNPGFESGNTGFSSDYNYSSGGNCCEGQYTVSSTPNTFNGFFVNPPPASPGSSQMMVVNGATVPNQRVWYVSVPVSLGTTYRFQLAGCTAVATGPAVLQWQVNGQLIGTPLPLPSVTQVWQINGATWTANVSGTVEVAVRNLNTSTFPNDFYIDDVYIGPCLGCWEHYGNGLPGAQGIPNLVPSAPPVLGTTIDLQMTTVRPVQEFGVLVLGLAPASVPTPIGGTLLVTQLSTVATFVPAAPAASTLTLVIPSAPSFSGVEIFAQFAHTDQSSTVGFAFTRGLRLVLGL